MYIHLKWKNKNTQDVTVNIYRSLTALDRNNLGTPLVTLAGNVEEYYDRDVTLGTTYNYVIQFVKGTNKVTSRNYAFVANYMRGPGNNIPVVGNDEHGFMWYGTFGPANDILEKLGIGRDTASPTDNPNVTTFKYTVDGEVYYFLLIPGTWINQTNALAFCKRTEPLAVTFDGLSYLAFMPNYKGDGYVQTSYSTQDPVGDRSLATKLTLPHLYYKSLRGIPGESIGCVYSYNITSAMIGSVDPSSEQFIAWRADIDKMVYTPSLSSSWILPVILKLVE